MHGDPRGADDQLGQVCSPVDRLRIRWPKHYGGKNEANGIESRDLIKLKEKRKKIQITDVVNQGI